MKTGCVTLGQLLTLSGYRSLSGAVCWKPSPRPVEEFGPPPGHTQGSRAASLPLLGSDKAENFLVFIWFSFECFQRQRGRSTTVPRKLVHVGRSLPENEVICSFFIFCCLFSFSTSHPASAVSPRENKAREGVSRAGWGKERGENPTGRGCPGRPLAAPDLCPAPASRSHPRLPRDRPKGELPVGCPRSGAASSANNNSK